MQDSLLIYRNSAVIDIWSVQPQPRLQPQAYPRAGTPSQNPSTATSSRTPSNGTTGPVTSEGPESSRPQGQEQKQAKGQDGLLSGASPIPGEFGGMRFLAYSDPHYPDSVNLSAVPKHWGEVVTTTRKGKKTRPGLDVDRGNSKGNDVFGVLEVN